MKTLKIRGAPNTYVCEEGILEQLETYLNAFQFRKGFVLHGERSWAAAEPYLQGIGDLNLQYIRYKGECSEQEIERISTMASYENPDFILGIGGGKVLDLTKMVATKSGCEAILIPTLAATCAAWTPVSVIYDENGTFIRYTILPKSPLLVFIEPRIILHSPLEYMRSGIGDTLAKWYEAESLTRHLDERSAAIQTALNTALHAKTILLEESEQALEAMQSGQICAAFQRVLETIIMLGGMVGGFGDHYGRISAAHSIHNGLTAVPATHHLLHGEKVAYGILVQLALEKNTKEIQSLLRLYKRLKLPSSLADLGLADAGINTLRIVAERSLANGESIHLLKEIYSVEDVVEAIRLLESLA